MKNKNKGFTLIELLAVIVILGLLMAIAIPSVTRYITQSRKKTLTTTMSNYMGALVNEMNNLEYTFTETNTVYAVPVECIDLERGGNNPLGEWHQANDKYFAYALVQYDDENSTYRYAFTFKDSAGYGLYPTDQNKISNQDKNIRTGLNLSRPKNGKITTITEINNWGESGFVVNENTNLVVLVAESEGKTGNGKTTCTLHQKGNNYAQVEEEKKNQNDNPVIPPEEVLPAKITVTSQCTSKYAMLVDDTRIFEYDYTSGMTWAEWFKSSYNMHYKISNNSLPSEGYTNLFDEDGAGVCCTFNLTDITDETNNSISITAPIKPGTYNFVTSNFTSTICWD